MSESAVEVPSIEVPEAFENIASCEKKLAAAKKAYKDAEQVVLEAQKEFDELPEDTIKAYKEWRKGLMASLEKSGLLPSLLAGYASAGKLEVAAAIAKDDKTTKTRAPRKPAPELADLKKFMKKAWKTTNEIKDWADEAGFSSAQAVKLAKNDEHFTEEEVPNHDGRGKPPKRFKVK